MTLTILLWMVALAQPQVTWALKTWRCDPAVNGENGLALMQRRFSLTLTKPGGRLRWSTVTSEKWPHTVDRLKARFGIE